MTELDCRARGAYVVRRVVRDGRAVIEKAPRDPHDEGAVSLLRHEHDILRRLAVPGVPIAIGLEKSNDANDRDAPRLVLEDAGSEDLAARLTAGPLGSEPFLDLAIEMTKTLARVHEKNVLHRDLSPASFVLGSSTDRCPVTLVGFDAATEAVGSVRPRHGAVSPYVAPELTGRLRRGPDQRADLYSLGAIFYEMLVGRPPFTQDDPIELIHAHLAKIPSAPAGLDPRIPRPLSDITLRLLAKAPEDRYQSADGLLFDLEEARRRLHTTKTIAAFELGRDELVRELPLPGGLYAREDALAAVGDAVERRDGGASAVLVITGAPGVGKTALGGALADHSRRRGRFLCGKCDVLATNRPYASLLDVFDELVDEMADKQEGERLALRARLLETIGPSVRALTELDPRLVRILGKTPPIPPLSASAAEARLHTALQSFVRALATERPLTLFFDDAQWADEATLKLVRALMVDPEQRSLLVCFTYRGDAVAMSTNPTIEAIRTAGVPVSLVELFPLDAAAVTAFLADTFRTTPETVGPLGVELHRKTAGSPLFLRRLLHTLHRRSLLVYDASARSWSWDVARIAATPIADDVVDLLLATIAVLERATQDALAAAACFGRRFELEEVATVTGIPADETARALWPAIHEGLIVPTLGGRSSRQPRTLYTFAHDRIQQAAYDLRAPGERQRIHLLIGRTLRAKDEPSTEFALADQLNLASPLITDPRERIELAELNLRSGEAAQRQSAHGPALAYFTHGLELLPEDAWNRHHALTFRLHHEAAASAGMIGELARTQELVTAALAATDSREDRAALYAISIASTALSGRFDEAIRILGEALPTFDIELPRDDVAAAAAREMTAAYTAITTHGADLHSARPMPASDLVVLRLLVSALPASFYADPSLMGWLAARIVSFAFAHGTTPAVCHAVSVLAIGLVVVGDASAANDVGKFAIRLAERLDSPGAAIRASLLHACVVMPWVAPFRSCLPILERPVDELLGLGEHLLAPWYVELTAAIQYSQGVELDAVLTTIQSGELLTRKLGNSLSGSFFELFGSSLRELAGVTSQGPLRLERASPACVCVYRVGQMRTSYLLGDLAGATSASSQAEALLPALGGLAMSLHEYHLFAALTAAAAAEGASVEERRDAVARIRVHRARFDQWARVCPDNFRHETSLLDAEIAKLEDRPLDAARLYEAAIDLAERDGFVQHAALANERCGRLHLGLGSHRVADTFLVAAMRGYARWGATVKVQSLSREFPRLRGELRLAASTTADVDLDVIGLLTAAEALASEVELDRLLDKLMRTSLGTAGAERGLLVLEDVVTGPHVRATATDAGVSLIRTPLALFPDVPHAVIDDARTRGKAVVLDDARRGHYAKDPDVLAREVRSLIALPIRRSERAIGVLYLENNLLVDAFAPERVRALELLSGHLAVALENGFLFDARRKAEAALRFLADASAALAESLDYEATLTRVARLVVPTLADICVIDLLQGGRIQRVAVAHVDPNKEPLLMKGGEGLLDPGSIHPVAQVMRTGKSWTTSNLDDASVRALARDTGEVTATRSLSLKSAIVVPLRARGRTLGTIGVYGEQAGGFPRCDPAIVEELGRRAGLALENARLYEETVATLHKRDEFLALASHELKTPLTSLQLALQPLADESVQLSRARTALAAGIATRQADRLTRLVGELLDVSRLRFGKIDLVREDVDLGGLATAAAERLEEDLRRARCTLAVHATSVVGHWDRSALDRVVTNLLANALKFGAGSSIELTVESDADNARLRVTDHGIGIPKDRIGGLFERFERAVTSRHYGGFGLGLYISRLVVEAHGGTIRAESEGPGTGTTFTVELPRSQGASTPGPIPVTSS